jgi:AbrB family looped-hinge helix DNA binding protein
MSAVSISPRYRITIPKDIREDNDLKIGDRLAFLSKGEEIVIFKVPIKPLVKIGGSLNTKKDVRKILQELKEADLRSERS